MILVMLLVLLLGAPQAPRPSPAPAPQPSRPPATQPARPQPATPAPAARPTFFTSTLPAAEVQNKQAVVETSMGTIVIDLLPAAAPNHVGHFITRARDRAYEGTFFIRY
jgi:hypothetical protein